MSYKNGQKGARSMCHNVCCYVLYVIAHMIQQWRKYLKVSNLSLTLAGIEMIDHSDVVGASPVGATPTTYSFST